MEIMISEKNRILHLTLLLITVNFAQAQIKVGDNPNTVNAASAIEVESTTKGILFPRMSTSQMNAISNPPNGLMIYNTTDSCLFYYHNAWLSSCDVANQVGSAWEDEGDYIQAADADGDGNTVAILDNGRVGIGLEDPSRSFHVASNDGIRLSLASNASSSSYDIHTTTNKISFDYVPEGTFMQLTNVGGSTSGQPSGSMRVMTANQTAYPNYSFINDINTGISNKVTQPDELTLITGGAERLRIDDSGNVGIGTSDPSYKLHTLGNALFHPGENNLGGGEPVGIEMFGRNGTAYGINGGIKFRWYNTNVSTIELVRGGSGADGAGIAFTTSTSASDTSNERMRITPAGLVGIGTSAPEEQLHIKNEEGTTSALKIESAVSGGAGYLQLVGNKNAGSLKIGGITMDNMVTGEGSDGSIDFYKGGVIAFSTGGSGYSEKMRLSSDGKLGIGVISAQKRLHVDADSDSLQIDNLAGSGNVLAIDNNGKVFKTSATPAGVMQIFAGSSAPTGYLICDGSAVSRTTYSDLFAVLGTTYGSGDGSTTFNLPDLRGRTAVGAGTGEYKTSGYAHSTSDTLIDKTVGEYGGAEYPTQLALGAGAGSSAVGPTNSIAANTGVDTIFTSNSGSSSTRTDGNSEGGNMQPYIVLNYIIKY